MPYVIHIWSQLPVKDSRNKTFCDIFFRRHDAQHSSGKTLAVWSAGRPRDHQARRRRGNGATGHQQGQRSQRPEGERGNVRMVSVSSCWPLNSWLLSQEFFQCGGAGDPQAASASCGRSVSTCIDVPRRLGTAPSVCPSLVNILSPMMLCCSRTAPQEVDMDELMAAMVLSSLSCSPPPQGSAHKDTAGKQQQEHKTKVMNIFPDYLPVSCFRSFDRRRRR